MTDYKNSLEFAQQCDREDPLAAFREQFHLPLDAAGNPQIYLCGNSLGLQPKQTKQFIDQELQDWAQLGVEGHTEARKPWLPYHEFLTPRMAAIVGAKEEEVVIMNGLTANLHLMMVSFYRPTKERYKVIIEKDAFPSDKYAVESQIRHHGFDPKEGLLLWSPRAGEELCRMEDLKTLMKAQGDQVALIMIDLRQPLGYGITSSIDISDLLATLFNRDSYHFSLCRQQYLLERNVLVIHFDQLLAIKSIPDTHQGF